MDLSAFQELRAPAGLDLLARLRAAGPLDDAAALALGSSLRRTYPPDLVAAAITMARLRDRGARKFGAAAATMWFTPAGLEQATHPAVAVHRAQRLTAVLGVAAPVIDLCCGIGSDLGALAGVGLQATGVELDSLTAAVAAANNAGLALVEHGDATARASGGEAVFVDPSRRAARGRIFDPNSYTPPWPFVSALLSGSSPAAAKVAPGIAHETVPAGVEIEWVSLHGELKEAALYGASLSSGARRRATLLPGGDTLAAIGPDISDEAPPVGAVGRWLYEPDPAVIRAHLVGAVVADLDGRLLDPTIAYLTADVPVVTPFARAYEVTDVLPFKIRALRDLLRRRGVGRLTVKKRGSTIEPEALRRELLRGSRGDAEATLIVTRVAGRATALLARPAPNPQASADQHM
jgi:THUMP domain-containing protein